MGAAWVAEGDNAPPIRRKHMLATLLVFLLVCLSI